MIVFYRFARADRELERGRERERRNGANGNHVGGGARAGGDDLGGKPHHLRGHAAKEMQGERWADTF